MSQDLKFSKIAGDWDRIGAVVILGTIILITILLLTRVMDILSSPTWVEKMWGPYVLNTGI